ncbi:hypothetical protein KAH55_05450, partial [bacterium]|nr:hypothetical protein [bacterium]
IEFELFDNKLYQQLMYFSHAVLTMKDMLAQRRPPAEKIQLEQALQNYQQQMAQIQGQLKMPFIGMNPSEIGTRADRELFYLKLGITNYLRGRGIIDDLDRLYRVYGVNYDVNAAFATLEKEYPFFEEIAAQMPRKLAQQGFGYMQQLIRGNAAEIEPPDKRNT